MPAVVQPDVAVILTAHPTHAMIGIDCLQASWHVLVEKPVAIQAIGNAMTLSSHRDGPVELPLDREQYRQLLARLQAA